MARYFKSIALILLILLSGCSTQNLSPEARHLCLDLASYSYNSVPLCSSQTDCFKKLDENFKLEFSSFHETSAKELFTYKNNLAYSWFYLSKSKKNLDEIYKICQNSNDFPLLVKESNDFKHNLVTSFGFLEKTIQDSFKALVAGRENLFTLDDIELIPEEQLFTDFEIVNENVTLLSQPREELSSYNKSSYVALYDLKQESFKKLSELLGLEEIPVRQFGVTDALKITNSNIQFIPLKFLRVTVPMFKNQINKIINTLEESINLHKANEILYSVKTNDIFALFEEFVGQNNSLSSNFILIFQSIEKNKKDLNSKNLSLISEAESELTYSKKLINSINFSTYSFDQNFLAQLYSLLGSTQNEISSSKTSIEAEYRLLSGRLNKISIDVKSKQASLGKTTSNLKTILDEIHKLNNELINYSDFSLSNLSNTCISRLDKITQELSKFNNLSIGNQIFNETLFNLKFSLSKFKENPSNLVYCKNSLELFSQLSYLSENFNSLGIIDSQNKEDCLKFLQEIFSSEEFDLSSYKEDFEKTKFSKNLVSCKNLQTEITDFIQSKEKVKSIISNHNSALEEFEYLKVLNSLGFLENEKFISLQKRLSLQSDLFKNGKLDLTKPNSLENLTNSSLTLLLDLQDAFYSSFINYLKANSAIQIFSPDKIIPEKDISSVLKIKIINQLRDLQKPVSFDLSISVTNISLLRSSNNFSSFERVSDKFKLNFSLMPLGETYLEFNSLQEPIKISEQTELLTFNLDKADLLKNIKTSNSVPINNLSISTKLTDKDNILQDSIIVKHDNSPVDFYLDSGKANFLVYNHSKQPIDLTYSLSKPISYSFNLESKNSDSNKSTFTYLLNIKNELDLPLSKEPISLPFPHADTKTTLLSSTGTQVSINLLPLNKISFSLPKLNPLQEEIFYLIQEIEDYSDYWNSVTEDLVLDLDILLSSNNSAIREKALDLKNQLISVDKNSNEKLVSLSSEIHSLITENETFESLLTSYMFEKNNVFEKLSTWKNDISILKGTSFFSDQKYYFEQAYSRFNEAEGLFNQNSLKEAFSLLQESLKIISENSFKPSTLFLAKKSSLEEQFFSLQKLSSDFKINDLNISDKKQGISSLVSELDSTIAKGNWKNSVSLIETISNKIQDLNTSINLQIESKSALLIQLFDLISSKLDYSIPESLILLEETMASIDLNQLSEFGYFPSLSKRKLNSFSTSFDKLKKDFSKLQENDLSNLFSKEDLINSINKDSLKLESDINSVLLQLEKDAFIYLEEASNQLSDSKNEKAKSLLSSSKSSFSNKDYLKSILLSNRATSLLSLKPITELPISLIPFAILISIALIMKTRKKSQDKLVPKKLYRNDCGFE